MYRKDQYRQFGITDFNQPIGLKMNPENRWVKKASMIPWKAIEEKYATLVPSKTGMPAKSLLVEFRKRLNDEVLNEINEMIIVFNTPDDPTPGGENPPDDDAPAEGEENTGTLVLDATCAPQNIKYPQDVSLLNEARENLEGLVDYLCTTFGYYTPRMYRKNARKDYLNLTKSKKRSKKKIRRAIKQQLQYIRRDRGYIEALLDDGCELTVRQRERLTVIDKVYEQQKYMYDNRIHTVADRIVSISQPYIRPIVRGKAKAPVEFGTKLDVSLDERGMARIERMSFDAYNESDVLKQAVENYKARTGHYPERVLVNQIYRTRANLAFCKERGIRISGPARGRPKKNFKADKKVEYKDNTDRIAVERAFALAKHSFGLGLVVTKRGETTRSSIALSILAMNLSRIIAGSLRYFLILIFSRCKQHNNTLTFIQNKCYENLAAC